MKTIEERLSRIEQNLGLKEEKPAMCPSKNRLVVNQYGNLEIQNEEHKIPIGFLSDDGKELCLCRLTKERLEEFSLNATPEDAADRHSYHQIAIKT